MSTGGKPSGGVRFAIKSAKGGVPDGNGYRERHVLLPLLWRVVQQRHWRCMWRLHG